MSSEFVVYPIFNPDISLINKYLRWANSAGVCTKKGKFYCEQARKLAEYKPTWPEGIQEYIEPYKKPHVSSTSVLKAGERVIGGLTKGSLVAYDEEGRMFAHWETFWSDDEFAPTRRWETQYDDIGRIVAVRIVRDSHRGIFDGAVSSVYVYTYSEDGNTFKVDGYLRYPQCIQDHVGEWIDIEQLLLPDLGFTDEMC